MKYVAYYRVSTKRQNLGLVAQKKTVLDYIKQNGGELIHEYEEKESGKDNNRDELNKAISFCKENNAILIIAKLDRLSRNVSFIFALKDAGISFYCCDIPTLNTLSLGLFAVIAQNERETISSRTKAALKAKKEQGYILGNPNAKFTNEMREKAAKINHNKANNNINNKRAYTVICSLIEKDMSLRSIATYLNNNEFRTARGYLFTPTTVSRLIRRYQ